jgi:C2 domain
VIALLTVTLLSRHNFIMFKFHCYTQDPYILLEFGTKFSKKTMTLQDSGSEGFWADLRMRCEVSQEDLFCEVLTIKAFDENNMTKDSLIGCATLSLKILASLPLFGTNSDVPILLFDSKNKPAGKLILHCGVHRVEEKKKLKVSPGFLHGVLHVKKINGQEMQGGGLFSKSIGELTTYIVVKVDVPMDKIRGAGPLKGVTEEGGKSLWTGSTGSKTGHSPVWDVLDLKPYVTAFSLAEGTMLVECWAKTLAGLGGDKLLGSGVAAMLPAGDANDLRQVCCVCQDSIHCIPNYDMIALPP